MIQLVYIRELLVIGYLMILRYLYPVYLQGVPKTWKFSDEFDIVFVIINIVIPNFNTHNIIMSARVYFMKTVNGAVKMSL